MTRESNPESPERESLTLSSELEDIQSNSFKEKYVTNRIRKKNYYYFLQ